MAFKSNAVRIVVHRLKAHDFIGDMLPFRQQTADKIEIGKTLNCIIGAFEMNTIVKLNIKLE